VSLLLEGEANDYLGKGLSGGVITVVPPRSSHLVAEDHVIAGNVLFYGATSGRAFIRGTVGERFAVRNSGAVVVVEGTGDHGCEYMTGGVVVILGATGRNFAAGMSGGVAYVRAERGAFALRCNTDMADVEPLSLEDEAIVEALVREHAERTGSELAKRILATEGHAAGFLKVIPREYRRVLERRKQAELRGTAPIAAE
jgi:glutamate synthase domain-containing protein 3